MAFCLYVALRPLWVFTGLGDVYGRLIRDLVGFVFLRTQHFQVLDSIDEVSIVNLDHLVVFAISLLIVSGRTSGTSWTRWIRRFVLVMLLIILFHVVTAFLSLNLKTAQDLILQQQLQILLPWEFRILDALKFSLYDLGLQAGPFVLMILSVVWNESSPTPPSHTLRARGAGGDPPQLGRARRLERGESRESATRVRLDRRWILGSLAFLVTVVSGIAFWSRWRESQPLHVAAHARLGQIYLDHGSLRASEAQYRIAVAGETRDPEVFYNLAKILSRRGARAESETLLRRGYLLAEDTGWRRRFEEALAQSATSKL